MGKFTGFGLTTAEQGAAINYKNVVNSMAIGTGTSEPSAADTSLEEEVFRKESQSTTRVNNEARNRAVFDVTEANGNIISEVGDYNELSGGDLMSRSVLPFPQEKTSDKTFIFISRNRFSAKNV